MLVQALNRLVVHLPLLIETLPIQCLEQWKVSGRNVTSRHMLLEVTE
jgi:hypothetical protein